MHIPIIYYVKDEQKAKEIYEEKGHGKGYLALQKLFKKYGYGVIPDRKNSIAVVDKK